jgi:hypothetical protein
LRVWRVHVYFGRRRGVKTAKSTADHLPMDIVTSGVYRFTQKTLLALVAATAETPLLLLPLLEIPHVVVFLAIKCVGCRRLLWAASNISLDINKMRRKGRGNKGERERK